MCQTPRVSDFDSHVLRQWPGIVQIEKFLVGCLQIVLNKTETRESADDGRGRKGECPATGDR